MKNRPNHLDLIELGKFYFLNGKLNQAQIEFERAAQINASSSEAYYNLGLVYESKNDRQSAQ